MSFRSAAMVPLVLLLLAAPAQSRTWYIKLDGTGDAPTVQAGVDSAAVNDTVLVAAGAYTWSNQGTIGDYMVFVLNKEICLRSESGPELTVLDAEGQGRVVAIGSQGTSTIEGFTITGGWADEMSAGGRGAGIFCSYASPTVIDNIITGNTAWYRGGGMYCAYCEATVIANQIVGNTAWGNGGGIECWYSDALITGNTFVDNTSAGASGVYCLESNPTITWNVFAGNSVDYGGVLTCLGSSPTIMNNTIVGNSTPRGAAIECVSSSSPEISNNIVAGSLGGPAINCDESSFPSVRCNDLWNNEGGNGSCALGADNFSADPLFCDEGTGNYRLHEDSPCDPSNSPAGCGLVGALPVGCWSAPFSTIGVALLAFCAAATGARAVNRKRLGKRTSQP